MSQLVTDGQLLRIDVLFPFYRNTHDNENHGHFRLQSRAESCLETKDPFGAEGRA
jgi:hypothetical protein